MKKLLIILIPFLLIIPNLLISQETFLFDSIPNPPTAYAGDSFYIHITCTSNANFNGAGVLSLRPSPGYNPMQPTGWILFNNGEWGGFATIFMASDSLHLNCSALGYNDTNLSPRLTILANVPKRLRLLLPTQVAKPGDLASRGRDYIFYVETANNSFNINVAITDYWWNPVGTGQDTIHLATNNPFPVFPADTSIISGNIDLAVRLRTEMDACTIFSSEVTLDTAPLMSDTSSTIRIIPGVFSKLLLIAPSQAVLAGDTTSYNSRLPGATPDTTDWQVAGSPFDVTVYAVDDCWNTIGGTAPGDRIRIYGTIGPYTISDTAVLTGGNATVTLTSNVSNWLYMQANDIDNSSMTTKYQTPINIVGASYRLEADEELDTIISGDPIHLHVYYEDESGNVITNGDHNVKIFVHYGSGSLTPTDTIVRRLTFGRVDPVANYITLQEEDVYLRVASADSSRKTNPGTNVDPVHVRPNVTPTEPVVNFPNPFGSVDKQTTIYYWLPQNCEVKVSIYDRFGNLVKTWSRNGHTGYNTVTWTGKNNKGTKVANGAYLLAIRATDRTEIVQDYRRWIAVVK